MKRHQHVRKLLILLVIVAMVATLHISCTTTSDEQTEPGRGERPSGPPPDGSDSSRMGPPPEEGTTPDTEQAKFAPLMIRGEAAWIDVHGAGCQRSDPKSGKLSEFEKAENGYYSAMAPQGDAIRIYNYVRLVRTESEATSYTVVDTGQTTYYGNDGEIEAPVSSDEPFYGQDARYRGNVPDYTISKDGYTVYDEATGLTWMRGPNDDLSPPVAEDKMTVTEAEAYVKEMNDKEYGGFSDWRIPSIKEQYSLILFSGLDVSGFEGDDTSKLVPFIDDEVFNYAYGDTDAGERIIDSQYLSSDSYLYQGDGELYYGVNFADGRIKGYGTMMMGNREKTFFVQLVRGNTAYGENDFSLNDDGTVSDHATGLMWSRDDSLFGMDWESALAWVNEKNEENWLGYSDWRLPDVKELESIVDYSHALDVDGEPAIDLEVFNASQIINEEGEPDYPWYWSSTTHASILGDGSYAAYVAVGRAMGYSAE